MSKVLITSALLYANGKIHFGHIAGAYLSADCYARFERMQGNDVLYISGSDEYGVAVTLSAELAGRTPQEQVDHFHRLNKGLFEQLNFSFDHYSRTTWEKHQEPVYQYFNDLHKNGLVDERETEQLWSEHEKRFLADRYVEGTCPYCKYDKARGDECGKCGRSYEATDLIDPKSKVSGHPLERRKTKNWYLCLDKFEERLAEWLKTRDWKPNVLNFVQHYVENLHPRAITRDSNWGVPVPMEGSENKVFYVWFEACIGYISAAMEWAEKIGQPERWKEYWCDPETKLVHFIGKDNIFFHAIFFPAMTMGQDQPYKLVDELPANEFLNLEGKQFSKSDNWYVDLEDFLTRYTADQIRYCLAANAPETADSEFTWKDFQMRCNSELLGKYGNLVNRTLVFAQKQCGGVVPGVVDEAFLGQVAGIVEQVREAYAGFSTRKACHGIMELAALGNGYFDGQKPWKAETQDEKDRTIASCLACLKALAVVSYPVIPETATKVWQMLGLEGAPTRWEGAVEPLVVGQALPKPAILFARVEDEQIAEEVAKLGKS